MEVFPALRAVAIPVFFIVCSSCWCDKIGRRPSASQMLPVLELMEPKSSLYDPLPEDTNSEKLRLILGKFFDSQVMSESEPEAYSLYPNGTVRLKLKKTRSGYLIPQGQPPRHIQRLHLQSLKMGDGKKTNLKLGKKAKRRFRDLLWLQSHCPLLQKWKDMGPRFWPRWFRENSCAPRPTCSFPRGMVCQPHKSTDKVLLRWHCQNWEEKKNCDWLKVQYPLVTECRCGC
ncbi:noggin-like [Uloborus diversus]|uniref:noggin-like n=1 Tax=Uloborus diversus TaxID=327109 RepID=UPI00240A18B5|nr:noggin-like [Uloborus diversus]